MKIISIIFLMIEWVFQINHFCGYYGIMGNEIEEKLDECFTSHVKNTRVLMSVGFEICFGFNY